MREVPYPVGSPEWRRRLREALERGEKPVDVYCFGTRKFRIARLPRGHRVWIWNEKTESWQEYPCENYIDICPICGRLMKVWYIPGTTILACCSEKCYEQYGRLTAES